MFSDFDGDGRPDLFFVGNLVPSRLYLNRGDMRFEDVTRKSGVVTRAWAGGVAVADVNNDGRPDILGVPWRTGGAPEQHYLIEQLPPLPALVTAATASRGTYRDRVHLSWLPVAGAVQSGRKLERGLARLHPKPGRTAHREVLRLRPTQGPCRRWNLVVGSARD